MTLGEDRGLTWQIGVWDDMAEVYLREIDQRFPADRRPPPDSCQSQARTTDSRPRHGHRVSGIELCASGRAGWLCDRGGHQPRDAGAGPRAGCQGGAPQCLLCRWTRRGDTRRQIQPGHRSSVAEPDVRDRSRRRRARDRTGVEARRPPGRGGLGGAGARGYRQAAADRRQLRAQASSRRRGAGRHGRSRARSWPSSRMLASMPGSSPKSPSSPSTISRPPGRSSPESPRRESNRNAWSRPRPPCAPRCGRRATAPDASGTRRSSSSACAST